MAKLSVPHLTAVVSGEGGIRNTRIAIALDGEVVGTYTIEEAIEFHSSLETACRMRDAMELR